MLLATRGRFHVPDSQAYDMKCKNGAFARIFVTNTSRFYFDLGRFLFARHRLLPFEYINNRGSLNGALIISYQPLSSVFLHDTLDHRNCRVAQIFAAHVNSTPSLTCYSELTGEITSEMKLVGRI